MFQLIFFVYNNFICLLSRLTSKEAFWNAVLVSINRRRFCAQNAKERRAIKRLNCSTHLIDSVSSFIWKKLETDWCSCLNWIWFSAAVSRCSSGRKLPGQAEKVDWTTHRAAISIRIVDRWQLSTTRSLSLMVLFSLKMLRSGQVCST